MNDTSHQNLPYVIAQAHAVLNSALESDLRSSGISVEQWRTLALLQDGKGLPMGKIASLVFMKQSALTKMVDKMVANGQVQRAVDPEDQRRVLLKITGQGKALYNQHKDSIQQQNVELESVFGEQNTAGLSELLQTLLQKTEQK